MLHEPAGGWHGCHYRQRCLAAIQKDLRATLAGLQWVVDAYTLVVASLLMLAGSMSDRFGRRRVFQIGLVVFTAGCAWGCGRRDGRQCPPRRRCRLYAGDSSHLVDHDSGRRDHSAARLGLEYGLGTLFWSDNGPVAIIREANTGFAPVRGRQ